MKRVHSDFHRAGHRISLTAIIEDGFVAGVMVLLAVAVITEIVGLFQ